MPAFAQHIGIDYSGASKSTSSRSGLRIYLAEDNTTPVEVMPPPSRRKYWTRKGIAEWLVEQVSNDVPTLVGIDHGFSFPLRYFRVHGLALDWPAFLDDFQRHWPTDEDGTWVRDFLCGRKGIGGVRRGDKNWFRRAEKRTATAKSVFDFDRKQGNVAYSTHAGIPWLRFIRHELGDRVHFWPFDGWDVQMGRSTIAEVYPALWSRGFAKEGRTGDQHDAYSIAAWLSRADQDGNLSAFLNPSLTKPERTTAQVEGWILGVQGRSERPRGRRPGGIVPYLRAMPDPIGDRERAQTRWGPERETP